MTIIDRAIAMALEAHGGDRNKHDGELYILHPHRVAILIEEAGGDEVQVAVAWLHDTVEDTSLLLSDIYKVFPDEPRIGLAVDAMTKRDGEARYDYWDRIRRNKDALFVKLRGDGIENFRRNHKIKDPAKRERLAAKYSEMFDYLTEREN